jgi:Ca2+/Na+ antiporter
MVNCTILCRLEHISHSPAFVLFSLCMCMCLSVYLSVSTLKGVAILFNLYYVVTVNKASWLEMVHSANRSSRKKQCLWMHIFQQCASEFETILLRR